MVYDDVEVLRLEGLLGIEEARSPDGAPQVHDTVGTGTWSVVAYE